MAVEIWVQVPSLALFILFYFMKFVKNFFFLRKILILKDVKWCGKFNSIFSLYELVFKKFVIDFIIEKEGNVKLLIKQKENIYINKLRLNKYLLVDKLEFIDLNKNIYVKVFLSKDISFVYKTDFEVIYNNNILFFKFFFLYDNIACFVYDNDLYIVNNTHIVLNMDDSFIDILINILENNKFKEILLKKNSDTQN